MSQISSDYKQCKSCDKLINIIDGHEECFRHRICNKSFPCEICKSWSLDQHEKVQRMIDKCRSSKTPGPSSPHTGTDQGATNSNPHKGVDLSISPSMGTTTCSTGLFNETTDLNAQAKDFFGNPFMWMQTSDFWKDMIDKRVQEALHSNSTIPIFTSTSTCTPTYTATVISTCSINSVSTNARPITSQSSSSTRHRFNKFANADYEDISDVESEISVAAPNNPSISGSRSDNENDEQSSLAGTSNIDQIDLNNNLSFANLMLKVSNELGIKVDDNKSEETHFDSVTDILSSDKKTNTAPRCRLPLDGVVLNALHTVDRELMSKGTLRNFKASDDEKFQISNDHFTKFCTSPHLDENAEEGLASCNQQNYSKNSSAKNSSFHFKNRDRFQHNMEMKKIDSQSRLLLRQISYGVLLTSYIAKVQDTDDKLDALKALVDVFKSMSDVTSRISLNTVKSRRVLHIKEMSFKNKSTENKLKQITSLGPNLFAGKFFDLLHDSAENIRDAKETQHLRIIKTSVNKHESGSKPSNNASGTYKRKVVDDIESSSKRFKSGGHVPRNKHKSQANTNQEKTGQAADAFQKKGPRHLGFRPPK